MNFKLSITTICFLIGVLLLTLHLILFSTTSSATNHKAESINLSLRQFAHQLYIVEEDRTSNIPPVIQISDNQFSLKMNKAIYYDTLPFILNKAFLDFNISSDYEVTIKDCENNSILLGYNLQAFQNKNIACIGREQTASCTIISLTFTDEKTTNLGYIIGAIIFFLIGLGAFLFKKITSFRSNNTIQSSNINEEEGIHLANSYFIPKELTIHVNNKIKSLTFRESKLLEYFFRKPDQILRRDDIKDHVWGEEGVIVGRSIDVFVSRLRKILKEDQALEINNIHGIGYRLEVKKT